MVKHPMIVFEGIQDTSLGLAPISSACRNMNVKLALHPLRELHLTLTARVVIDCVRSHVWVFKPSESLPSPLFTTWTNASNTVQGDGDGGVSCRKELGRTRMTAGNSIQG